MSVREAEALVQSLLNPVVKTESKAHQPTVIRCVWKNHCLKHWVQGDD